MGAGFGIPSSTTLYPLHPGGVYGAGTVLHNPFPPFRWVRSATLRSTCPFMCIAVLVFGGKARRSSHGAAAHSTTPPTCEHPHPSRFIPTRRPCGRSTPRPAAHASSSDLFRTIIRRSPASWVPCWSAWARACRAASRPLRRAARGHRGHAVQKYAGTKLSSTGIPGWADGAVTCSGLVVIGFGLGNPPARRGRLDADASIRSSRSNTPHRAWCGLTCPDGASYDKPLFTVSDKHAMLKEFIIRDLDRSATYIKIGRACIHRRFWREMTSSLVVSRKRCARLVQHKIKELDPHGVRRRHGCVRHPRRRFQIS